MRDDDPLKYFPGYAEACAKAEPNNLVPEAARPDKASSTARAGYPLRSLEEFAQLLIKHRLMHECAWFDPEGYDGGATLERLSRAFHEATDNGKLADYTLHGFSFASSEARQAAADGHHLWTAFIAFTIKQGYDGEPTMDDSRDRELFEAFAEGGWHEAQRIASFGHEPGCPWLACRALTWCADRPAAAGRFWWQSSPLDDAIVVTVFPSPEGLSVRTERGHMMMFLFSRLWPEQRWAGPLPEPQEPSPVESSGNGPSSATAGEGGRNV